jgi:hypothetical protein
MAKKSKVELETELRFLRRHRIGDSIATVLNNLIRWSGLVGIAYFLFRSIDILAGQHTEANFGIEFLSKIQITYKLAIAITAGAIFYAQRQRKLRRDVVERLAKRIQELELRIDPQRSSSLLTPRGDTREEDRK